jgi:membrane protein DedA with SNARE-associated domain
VTSQVTVPPLPGLAFLGERIDLPAILNAVLSLYDRYGYAVVFLGAWMEHTLLLGVIVPGGTLVTLGGAAARLGNMQLAATVAVGVAGMVAGAATDYWLGRSGLSAVLLRSRLGTRIRPSLDRAGDLLRRHGWWAITLVHVLGAGRSAMAVTAGICRMPFWRFLLCELPAAVLWSTFFTLLGYGVATNLDPLVRLVQRAGSGIVLVLLTLLVVRWLWRRRTHGVKCAAP